MKAVSASRPPLAEYITEEFRQRVPFSVFTTNPCRCVCVREKRVCVCVREKECDVRESVRACGERERVREEWECERVCETQSD